jgi:hypothetical protein
MIMVKVKKPKKLRGSLLNNAYYRICCIAKIKIYFSTFNNARKLISMEIIIKIDLRSKQAKAFLEYLKVLPFVQIEKLEEARYSSEFVAKIKKGETDIKDGKATRINPNNIWESIL